MAKGGNFEREICKRLSRWWTDGERDDVFWRSQTSGARATQRLKKGLRTFGAYGDVAAVDPIGNPLLQLFTIELKRGRSHGCPADLIDSNPKNKHSPFRKTLQQTIRGHQNAGSLGWMLICRRDHRIPIVYADMSTCRRLDNPLLFHSPCYLFRIVMGRPLSFIGTPLDTFLDRINPQDIQQAVSDLG